MKRPREDTRVIQLVEWLRKHDDVRYYLLGHDNVLPKPAELLKAIEECERSGYYDLILFLMEKFQYDGVYGKALDNFCTDKLIAEWKRTGTRQMCTELKGYLKREAKQKGMEV